MIRIVMASARQKPRTIDEYITKVNSDQRATLEKLRRTILAAAPGAEECISYGIPAFRLNGRSLVFFGAWANHCAFYPGNSVTLKTFRNDLKAFQTSKGHDSLFTGETLTRGPREKAGQSSDGRGQGLIRCDREQMLHLGK